MVKKKITALPKPKPTRACAVCAIVVDNWDKECPKCKGTQFRTAKG